MGNNIKIAASLFFLVFSLQVFSCNEQGTEGIVEENNLFIPVGAKTLGGITEEQFNSTIERVIKIYAPIIEAKGKILEVVRKWEDGTVNAYAQQTGNTWKVSMFGGLARHKAISQDGFATVLCHELGHHLGGAPKKASWWGVTWASNEGQSDYFATSKCLRKYMETEDSQTIVANMKTVPVLLGQKCEAIFTNGEEVARCIRGGMAGMSLASLFKSLRNSTTPLEFHTPDTAVVRKTNHSHPASQCRLDTYFQGSICEKGAYDDVSNTDETVGTCTRVNGHKDGVRPLCWLKPASM